MTWEIFSYGSGDFLRMIFTAIASIFGNGDYWDAVKVVTLASFVGIMVKVAFSRDGAHNFRYVMTLILFINVVMIPKTKVVITDTIVPANSAVVANVPLGIAMTAGAFSQISMWATKATETVFSLPAELRSTRTGFLFHSEMMKAVGKVKITDPRTMENYRKFFASCVIVDGIGHQRFSWEDMLNAPNLDRFLKTSVSTGVAGFFYTAADGSQSFQFCRAGYGLISTDITNNIPQAIKQISIPWAAQYNGIDNAANMVNSNLGKTVDALTKSGANKETITRQFMLTNELDAALSAMAADVNDQTMENYIIARANLERTKTFSAVGKVAAEKLPLLRVIFEGVIYAVFPLILLVALANPLAVTTGYVKALLWISLWMPMFAILHFARAYFDAQNLENVSALYGGLSPNAISEVNSYLSEASGISGYMMGALPIITWLLISASGAMMASFASRAIEGFERSVDKGTDETLRGSGQANGKDWKATQQAEQTNGALASADSGAGLSAFSGGTALAGATGGAVLSSTMGSGTSVTQSPTGNVAMQQPISSTYVSQSAAQTLLQSSQASLTESKALEQGTAQSLSEATSATLTTANAAIHKAMSSTTMTDADKHAVQESVNNANTTLTQSANEWAKSNNFSVSGSGSASASVNAKVIGGGGTISASHTDGESIMNRYLQTEQGQTTLANAVSNVNETMRSVSKGVSDESSNSITSALQHQKTASEAHTAAVKDVESAQKTVSLAEQNARSVTVDKTDQLLNYAVSQAGYNPESYDNMLRGVRDGDKGSLAEYKALVVATGNRGEHEKGVSATYNEGSAAIQKLADATLGTAEIKNEAAVQAQYQSNSGQVASQSNVSEGAVRSAIHDPTGGGVGGGGGLGAGAGGSSNAGLSSEVNPDGRSVPKELAAKTGEAVGETARLTGEAARAVHEFDKLNPVEKAGVALVTGVVATNHLVQKFKEGFNGDDKPEKPDPMDGNRPKK